ncbi:MAG: MoaD/ThiS family protein [Planctomycetales bacterium]|nr:MoaD/ThiS family protein [Planctomycetales bacterium]
MPHVAFTSHLARHLDCPPYETDAKTVSAALEAAFLRHPLLRSYLLDDQGRLRQHVMVFINDQPVADRERLSDPLQSDSRIFVMQALSGG